VSLGKYYSDMYVNGKIRPVEAIPGTGRRGIKENDGGDVNLTMICKHFVNVTIYPQCSNNIIIKTNKTSF
jgi:hypothetical protein